MRSLLTDFIMSTYSFGISYLFFVSLAHFESIVCHYCLLFILNLNLILYLFQLPKQNVYNLLLLLLLLLLL